MQFFALKCPYFMQIFPNAAALISPAPSHPHWQTHSRYSQIIMQNKNFSNVCIKNRMLFQKELQKFNYGKCLLTHYLAQNMVGESKKVLPKHLLKTLELILFTYFGHILVNLCLCNLLLVK